MPPRTPPPSLDDTRSEQVAGLDASKLSFSSKLVISIIAGLATIVMPILGAVASIRSDVRDMSTRQEMRDEVRSQEITELKQTVKLQGLDINDIKLSLAKGNGGQR